MSHRRDHAITSALTGTDAEFAATWAEEGKGTAAARSAPSAPPPPPGSTGCMPPRYPASGVMPTSRTAPGRARKSPTASPASPQTWPDPASGLLHPPALGIENREHYVRDATFREDAQKTRTGNQPNARAAIRALVIRALVIRALRHTGHANIARARRYYGRADQRILALYGYA